MRFKRLLILIVACATALGAVAQDFSDLRRSSRQKSDLYLTIERVLAGTQSVDQARGTLSSQGDLTEAYGGQTPIYLVLDFLATTPISEAKRGEDVLDILMQRSDFQINARYRDLPPALPYVLRASYTHLNSKFDVNHLSPVVVRKLLSAGASVNTRTADGASLIDYARVCSDRGLFEDLLKKGYSEAYGSAKYDVLERMVLAQDRKSLKTLIDQGVGKLYLSSFSGETPKIKKDVFVRDTALYRYIALCCAQTTFEEKGVLLYRKTFPEYKSFVEEKYDHYALIRAKSVGELRSIKYLDDFLESKALLRYRQHLYDSITRSIRESYVKVQNSLLRGEIHPSREEWSRGWPSTLDLDYYDPDSVIKQYKFLDLVFKVEEGLNYLISSRVRTSTQGLLYSIDWPDYVYMLDDNLLKLEKMGYRNLGVLKKRVADKIAERRQQNGLDRERIRESNRLAGIFRRKLEAELGTGFKQNLLKTTLWYDKSREIRFYAVKYDFPIELNRRIPSIIIIRMTMFKDLSPGPARIVDVIHIDNDPESFSEVYLKEGKDWSWAGFWKKKLMSWSELKKFETGYYRRSSWEAAEEVYEQFKKSMVELYKDR